MKTLHATTLWPVLPIFLFFIYTTGCQKDAIPSSAKTYLTIEEAKQIFFLNTKPGHNVGQLRTDSIEAESNNPLVTPDWVNAVLYSDDIRHLTVVEVPILANHLTKILIVAENSTIDSSHFDETIQVNKLVFVQDSNDVVNFAIMKINGTPNYLASHDINNNSFRWVENDFEGRLAYYNFNDSFLNAYLVRDGNFYEALSPSDTGEISTAQERWGFCFDHFEYVSCTGADHTWEQRDQCKCGISASCTPPRRIAIMVECGGALATNGGTSGCCLPPPPDTDGNVGGGSSNNNYNPNNAICFIHNVNEFNDEYGTNLLNDYEDQAFECMNGCAEDYEDFEDCVYDGIVSAYYPQGPGIPIIDVKDALDDCFGTSCINCTYSATIFIEQPVPGMRETYAWTWGGSGGSGSGGGSVGYNTGHTFLELSQTNSSGVTTTKAIGFYPVKYPKGAGEVKGYFHNETANSVYNIKVKFDIDQGQFTNIRNTLNNIYINFAIEYNNCTTSVAAALNSASLNIPLTPRHQSPIGQILGNPGDLGEDLRANPRGGIFSSTPTVQNFSPSSCQ